MSFAGVCLSVMTCLSVTMPIYAPPTCPPIADLRKVGFCSSNGSYHEWDCMNCPPGLGLSVECGKVYDKVIKVECQPCKKGTFSENNDFGQCKPCSRCQENEVQSGQCKADKDAIQCTGVCKTGYYKAHGSCKPCSWCCGDNKTNEYVHECRNLQKKCSFQDVKSCGPTTPAPTILSTSVSTTSTSTTEESSSTPTQTEMTEITASTKNNLSTKETLTDTRGSIDSTEDEKETSGDKGSDGIILPIVIVLLVLLIVLIACILGYCFWKKNGTSSGCDSEQVSTSTSTSGDFKSTEPLISKEKGKPTQQNGEEIHIHSEDTVAFHKTPEKGTSSGCDSEQVSISTSTSGDFKSTEPNNGVGPSQATKTVCLQTRLNQQKLCFICEKLGPKIENLKHEVMQILFEMLNVQICGKDYRNLDSFCNLTYHKKKWLGERENPMEYIIEIMTGQSVTLESFLDELYRISRGDVVEKLYEVANQVDNLRIICCTKAGILAIRGFISEAKKDQILHDVCLMMAGSSCKTKGLWYMNIALFNPIENL